MDTNLTPYQALEKAIEIAGGQSALARVCGLSQTAVWKWKQSSKRVPGDYVLSVEAATGIPCSVLRPDIFPADRFPPQNQWRGVDQSTDALVFPDRATRNGNRVAFLDNLAMRSVIG